MSEDIVDDVMLHDSESMGVYDEPTQPEVATEEHNLMSSSYPIMDELIEWFDKWIEHARSIDAIDVDDSSDDAKVTRQIMVNKQIALKVQAKRNELNAKFSEYKRQMNGGDDAE